MPDIATPNLPSPDFDVTAAFYQSIGFQVDFKDDGWMILVDGALKLEFFPYPALKPESNFFSTCLRLDDVDAFYARCLAAGVAERCRGIPLLVAPKLEDFGLRIGTLIDPHGTLLRLIQNDP